MYSLVAKLIGSELHRTKSDDDSDHHSEEDATKAVNQAKPKKRRNSRNNKTASHETMLAYRVLCFVDFASSSSQRAYSELT